jgi:hypothetical protein
MEHSNMDLKTLERMTVVKLREEALKVTELTGVRGMTKEELIRALAKAHGIDLSTRARGGSGKSDLKKQIRALKAKIAAAIQSKEKPELKKLRRQVKRLKAETRDIAAAAKQSPSAGETAPSATPA